MRNCRAEDEPQSEITPRLRMRKESVQPELRLAVAVCRLLLPPHQPCPASVNLNLNRLRWDCGLWILLSPPWLGWGPFTAPLSHVFITKPSGDRFKYKSQYSRNVKGEMFLWEVVRFIVIRRDVLVTPMCVCGWSYLRLRLCNPPIGPDRMAFDSQPMAGTGTFKSLYENVDSSWLNSVESDNSEQACPLWSV